MPEIGVEYDWVHLTGERHEIAEYEREHYNSEFGIDWRQEDVDTVREIARCVDAPGLTAEYVIHGKTEKILIAYDGKQKRIAMTGDRKIALRTVANFLKSDYEIRVFRESTLSDTIECIIKPRDWWKAMDRRFRDRMNEVFIKLRDLAWLD